MVSKRYMTQLLLYLFLALLVGCASSQSKSTVERNSGESANTPLTLEQTIHIQNARTVLHSLALLQRRELEALEVNLLQLLSDELTVLNGVDWSALPPERVSKNFCAWRQHLETARNIVATQAEKKSSRNLNATAQLDVYDRTISAIKKVCA
jgi:hypothetical protein